MPSLAIKTARCNDPEPAFPVPPEKYKGELKLVNCSLIEQGMGSGKTSIAFSAVDENGNAYFIQTSADLLRAAVAALNGAEAFWAENPVENIYKS